MGCEPRVDFAVKYVVDTIFQRAICIDLGHLSVGRFNGELAAHAVSVEIHHRLFQKGQAVFIEKDVDFLEFQQHVCRLFFAGSAISQAGFRIGRTWLSNKDAYCNTLNVLLFQQFC